MEPWIYTIFNERITEKSTGSDKKLIVSRYFLYRMQPNRKNRRRINEWRQHMIEKLAFSLGRNDELPNIELAQQL